MTTSSVCHHGASGAPAASVLGEPGGDGLLGIASTMSRTNLNRLRTHAATKITNANAELRIRTAWPMSATMLGRLARVSVRR